MRLRTGILDDGQRDGPDHPTERSRDAGFRAGHGVPRWDIDLSLAELTRAHDALAEVFA
jgi:hypothetical protein